MARRRLGVVLLVPPPQSTEIDGLRRGCGDTMLGRVPPHITLVPPVNVAADALPAALGVLRSAAEALGGPITLALGPPTTFEPVSPTLYLAVTHPEDQPGELNRLQTLGRLAFAGPFERPLTHAFVPHVTLVDNATAEQLALTASALQSYRIHATFPSVHVLQEHRDADGVRRWRPLADALLGPRAVVGRGGLAVELSTSTIVGPDGAGLWELIDGAGPPPEAGSDTAADKVVVTARRDHEVLGVAAVTLAVDPAGAGIARVDGVVVDPRHRRQGVGRALLDALGHRLSIRGVRWADALVGSDAAASLLTSRGWVEANPGNFCRSWD